jgi:hypothetical protein
MDAAAEARAEGKQGNQMQDAMEFLETTITDVPTEVQKLYRMAEKRSISTKMLDRAASKMSVKKKSKGKGKERVETWVIESDESEE